VWFTEVGANQIGRITPTGTITEFPVSSAGALLEEEKIAAGSDGNLWFTEKGINSIGRITTDGVITEFPIPSSATDPDGIASGPDGDLWFTESDANQIGRISTAGDITEFPVPTEASDPTGITAGVDGSLWFVEGDANQIGRITTDGEFTSDGHDTEFSVPTVGSAPEQITTGPDGNLWFVESGANRIGRVQAVGRYLSLGDSFSSGEGLGAYIAGTDKSGLNQCHRSLASYPVLLDGDAALGSATFGACSGALARNFYESQYPDQAPQLDFLGPAPGTGAVNHDTKTVTLTIGGNDVGFPDVLAACIAAHVTFGTLTIPFPAKDYGCPDRVDTDFGGRALNNHGLTWSEVTQQRINALTGRKSSWPYDTDGKAIRPLFGLLRDIHARAPDATIYVADYPRLFSTEKLQFNGDLVNPINECDIFHDTSLAGATGLLSGKATIGQPDLEWLLGAGLNLDAGIVRVIKEAQAGGLPVKQVDVLRRFTGHALCDAAAPWVNELHLELRTGPYVGVAPNPGSFHPTADGVRCGYEAAFLESFTLPNPKGC
jgi:hypothetical protein